MNDSKRASDGPRRRHVIQRDERATEAVVEAVATAEGVERETLPALGAHLDPDALDDLFATRTPSPAAGLVFTRTTEIPSDLEVQFRYAGYVVTVTENYVLLE